MPLDGLSIRALADDLGSSLTGARIERIYQPRPLALSMKLFHRQHTGFLFVTLESSKPLLWFSEEGPRDASLQSGFLQVMRKYLEGSRIASVTQHPGWERILYIDCSPSGDVYLMSRSESASSGLRLVAELMGRNSNLILLDQAGKILGSLRRPPEDSSGIATDRLRPGGHYALPPSEPKIRPEDLDGETLFVAFKKVVASRVTPPRPLVLKDALVSVVAGLGPSTAIQMCAEAGVPATQPVQDIPREVLDRLSKVVRGLAKRVESGEVVPTLVLGPMQSSSRKDSPEVSAAARPVRKATVGLKLDEVPGVRKLIVPGEEIPDFPVVPVDFFPFEPVPADGSEPDPPHDHGETGRNTFTLHFTSMKAMLYVYGWSTSVLRQAEALKRSLAAYLVNRLQSLENKKKAQLEDLSRAEEALSYRRFGDLLMAHSGKVGPGVDAVVLEDFETEEPVRIPLDPSLSPTANAQRYYTKYRKAKRAVAVIRDHVEKTDIEIAYLEQSLESVRSAQDFENLKAIEEEVYTLDSNKADNGLRSVPARSRPTGGSRYRGREDRGREDRGREDRTRKAPWEDIYHFTTRDGYHVYVGKSDKQNELLTFKVARPDDVWLHVKDAPGAHVVIRVPEGSKSGGDVDLPETTLIEAARAAAFFSKSRLGQNVPVDWTRRRNVYRLRGMPPGKVLYKGHRTIYVDPKEP